MPTAENKQKIITIDGPAGVGKSTVSLLVAKSTGFFLLDTGAMYRAVGFHLNKNGIAIKDETAIANALDKIQLELLPAPTTESYTRVILNGEEITTVIRSPEMSMVASKVSAFASVRSFLTRQQRQYGEKGEIVAEGRDMGSVVFPDAAWKFYLDADPEVRARRRCQQLAEKGEVVDYKKMLEAILQRDKNDSSREIAPLCRAEDALLVDTTYLSKEEVVARILGRVKQ